MRVNGTIAALLVSLAVPAAAVAQGSTSNNGNSVSSKDAPISGQQFLKQVGDDSVNEIHEALLAEAKAQDPAVRAYARLMINDHTILASQLGAIAGDGAFSMPITSQDESGMKELQSLKGAQFDRTFVEHEIKQHRESVQSWQRQAQAASGNSETAAFAKLGLPLQREHLALALAVQSQLGKSGQ